MEDVCCRDLIEDLRSTEDDMEPIARTMSRAYYFLKEAPNRPNVDLNAMDPVPFGTSVPFCAASLPRGSDEETMMRVYAAATAYMFHWKRYELRGDSALVGTDHNNSRSPASSSNYKRRLNQQTLHDSAKYRKN